MLEIARKSLILHPERQLECQQASCRHQGKVLEWLKRHAWKAC